MSDLRSTEQIEEHKDELKRVKGPGLLLLFIIGALRTCGGSGATRRVSGVG